MAAGCSTTTQWTTMVNALPVKFTAACVDGMDDAMKVVADIARRTARWQPDGTDNGKWLVTGTARESIHGSVAGLPTTMPTFNVTDPVYGSHHVSPMGSGASQMLPRPDAVVGAITMTEQHSERLQEYERNGTKSGMMAGENITVEALKNNEPVVWAAIRGKIAVHFP